jgi:hypothetical protein
VLSQNQKLYKCVEKLFDFFLLTPTGWILNIIIFKMSIKKTTSHNFPSDIPF